MCPDMCVELRFSRSYSRPKELSAVFAFLPSQVLLVCYRSANGSFGGCCECSQGVWFWWRFGIWSCVRINPGRLFRSVISSFVTRHSDVCRYLSKLDLPSLASSLVKRSYRLDQSVPFGGGSALTQRWLSMSCRERSCRAVNRILQIMRL